MFEYIWPFVENSACDMIVQRMVWSVRILQRMA